MRDREPQQVILPLELFFGAKLLVTCALIRYITALPQFREHSPFGPLVFILVCLVALQLFIMVGLSRHMDQARQLGLGVCIAGGTIAIVLCLLGFFAGYAMLIVTGLGLVLLLLNAAAFVALLSRPAREWCDVKPGSLPE